MLKYLARRLLYMIPTLVAITLLTFVISLHTPGDPAMLKLRNSEASGPGGAREFWPAYARERAKLKLDMPVFYFSLSRLALPDTFYRIAIPAHREMLDKLCWEYGNWPQISKYYQRLMQAWLHPAEERDEMQDAALHHLLVASNAHERNHWLKKLDGSRFGPVLEAWAELQSKARPWKNYIPSIHWHGIKNQYHYWLFGDGRENKGLLRGDLGRSFRSHRKVNEILSSAILVTLQISIFALLFAFLLSVPSGLFLAGRAGSFLDRSLSSLLFALYSTPAFWLGTLLIVFLGGGDFLNLFPPFGPGDISHMGFFDALLFRLWHLVLPVFCLFYPAYTYLTRQMRNSALEEMHKPYVRALKARGIPLSRIRRKDIFINASLPHITLLGSFIPLIISGSVMIEVVFSLPGMGKTTLDALYARDYPVVFGAVLITSAFTVLGFLLSDILYHLADPPKQVKKENV